MVRWQQTCLPVLLALVGCGESVSPEVVPPLEKVTGKVTLDGKPEAGIAVTFVPAANHQGNSASGATDGTGLFSLSYRTGDEGIPAGDYVAMFSKLTQPDGSPIPPDKTAADVMAVDRIPQKYRLAENPHLTVTVPPGGKSFEFDLKTR